MFFIARSSQFDFPQFGSPIERRADVLFSVRQFGQWHLEGFAGGQLLNVAEQGENNCLVLSITAVWNVLPLHSLKSHRTLRFPISAHLLSPFVNDVQS